MNKFIQITLKKIREINKRFQLNMKKRQELKETEIENNEEHEISPTRSSL